MLEDKINRRLNEVKNQGSYRSLKGEKSLIDFSSNDYLGLIHDIEFKLQVDEFKNPGKEVIKGSSGSRLLTGNSKELEELEVFLSSYYKASDCLFFSSGYQANLGLFSCLLGRGDTYIYDEECHASIKDGMRLSMANRYSFKHNDFEDLRNKLGRATGDIVVAVESVYSMSGHVVDLEKVVGVCEEFRASLIVDEAHAVGLFGEKGRGLVDELGLNEKVFARIVGFGKAIGFQGGAVLCSRKTKDFLVNFSRPFIYTTAPSETVVFGVKLQHDKMSKSINKANITRELIELYKGLIKGIGLNGFSSNNSAVQFVKIGDNKQTKSLSLLLEERGFDVRPILSPTVKKGEEGLRIILHAFNSKEQLTELIHIIKSELKK